MIDLAGDSANEVSLGDEADGELSFTPAGDLLARLIHCNGRAELQVYESATGRLLAKWASKHLYLQALTDDALFFTTGTEEAYLGCTDLEIWSVPERRRLATVPSARSATISPDGSVLLIERANAIGSPTGMWAIWGMQQLRIKTEFSAEIETPPQFSPDNRWLAIQTKSLRGDGESEHFVELRECSSGRLTAKLPKWIRGMHFSPDGRWLALDEQLGPDVPEPDAASEVPLLMAETPALGVGWTLTDRFPEVEVDFSHDSCAVFTVSKENSEVVARESVSGNTRRRFPLRLEGGRMRPDRRTLLLYGGFNAQGGPARPHPVDRSAHAETGRYRHCHRYGFLRGAVPPDRLGHGICPPIGRRHRARYKRQRS